MLSCLRAEQYKVGVVLIMISDRWRSSLAKMLNSKVTFFCFLLAFTHVFGEYTADTASNKNHVPIFCYINGTDWIINSINNSEFDVNLCSYVFIHGTVNTDNWTIKLVHPNWEETLSNDMRKLKAANNNLKFVISIKKISNQTNYFPLLAFKHHSEFATNAKLFIKKYKFDGIHIDWWYPETYSFVYSEDEDDDEDNEAYTLRPASGNYTEDESYTLRPTSSNYTEDDSYDDKDNSDKELDDYDENDEDDDLQDNDFQTPGRKYFLRLIKELKSQLGEDGSLIAVSVGAYAENLNRKYDLANLKSIVDYWIIMAMRYNKNYISKILQDAPIRTNNPALGVKATIESVKKAIGPDFNKIVLAIPFSALAYKLRRPLKENQNPFENEIKGRLKTKSAFTYNAVCKLVKQIKQSNITWSHAYNTTAESPYLIRRKTVVLYEDPQSVRAKTNLALNEGLGGIMPYNIDMDDYKGSCNENIKYPLIKTIHDTIHSPSSDAWKTYQMSL